MSGDWRGTYATRYVDRIVLRNTGTLWPVETRPPAPVARRPATYVDAWFEAFAFPLRARQDGSDRAA